MPVALILELVELPDFTKNMHVQQKEAVSWHISSAFMKLYFAA